MKLRNKLILSCAALAAVATTAVSTTYAWYTANDSVKAEGINAQTSQTDNTLLLISKTGQSGSWGAKVNIGSAITLNPVSYETAERYFATQDTDIVTGKKYFTRSGEEGSYTYTEVETPAKASLNTYFEKIAANTYHAWDNAANEVNSIEAQGGITGTKDYLSFYLYFKSGSNANLDVKIKSFTLTNNQAAELPTKSVLAEGTTSTDNTYTVDMLRALNFVTTIQNGKEVASGADSPVVTSAVTAAATETTPAVARTAYNCNSLASADSLTGDTAAATDSTWGSKYNAHHYYNKVKGTEISESKLYSETTTDIATFATTGFTVGQTLSGADASGIDNILMVKFDIYLDGWNAACFDAVRQQSFTLTMEFDGTTHSGD